MDVTGKNFASQGKRLARSLPAMLLAGVAPLVIGSANAHAAGAAADQTNQVEDVVVTARKQSELASQSPVALSAESGANMKREGIITVDDVIAVAPDMVIDHSVNGVNIALRGVQNNDQGVTQTAGVAVILDGIEQQDTNSLITPFFDVDHVEVLRGPQGTLYGAASPGGVINVISNRPTWQQGGSADVELGNYNTKRANLVINAPVSDVLATRLAINYNDRDGYLIQSGTLPGSANLQPGGDKAQNGEHDYSARGSLFYKPNDVTNALLQLTVQHSYDSAYSSVPYKDAMSSTSGPSQRSGPANAITPNTDDTFYTANTDINSQFGDVAVQFLGGYQKGTLNDMPVDNGGIIPPGGPGWIWGLTHTDESTSSAELRLHNAKPAKFEWAVGVSYLGLRESGYNVSLGAPCQNAVPACFGGDPGPVNPDPADSFISSSTQSTVTRQSTAAYATGQYHVTDTLELTLGLREADDSIGQRSQGFHYFGPTAGDPCTYPTLFSTTACLGAGQGNNANQHYDADKLTWKVGLDWKPSSEQLFYAAISTGYKPGGFNSPSSFLQVPLSYNAENLIDYEVGYKGHPTSWLYLDSDIFYYDYQSMQVGSEFQVGNPNAGGPAQFVGTTLNTPATVYGIENRGVITLTHADRLTIGFNYLHAVFDDLYAGGNAGNPYVSWKGKELNNSPTVTASLAYRHTFDLHELGDIVFNANTSYTEKYFINVISNNQIYRQPSFTKSGMDLTYTTRNGKYWVQAFVKNIEDRVEITFFQGNPFQLGNGNVGISEPRFVGIRFGEKL